MPLSGRVPIRGQEIIVFRNIWCGLFGCNNRYIIRPLILLPAQLGIVFIVFRLQEKQNLLLTPYEKNLDVWRQLWRVIERRLVPNPVESNMLKV